MTWQFQTKGVFIAFLTASVAYTTARVPRCKFAYTFHTTPGSWNEALAECEGRNETLVQLNSPQKLEDFRYLPLSWGSIPVWIGVYDWSPPDMNYTWTGCTSADQSASWPWHPVEPDNLLNSHCLRVHRWLWRTTHCTLRIRFICEKYEGSCTFLVLNNVTLKGNANVTSAGSMTKTECRDLCLTYHAEEKECVAFSHDKRTDTCLLLKQTHIYTSDSPTTSSDQNSITAVKKCYDYHTSDEPLRYSDNVKQLNSICTTLNTQNECMDAQGAPDASSSSHVGLASSLAPTQSSDWRLLSLSDVNGVASEVAVDTKTISGLHTRSIKSPQTSPSELQPSLPILHQTETAGPALPSQTQIQDTASTLHYDASAGPAFPSQTQIQDSASTSHRDATADVLQTRVPDMNRTCLCRCSAFHTANNAQAPTINQSKLRVDRHNLSSYRRRLTSAVDDRPSARVVGSVLGVALLVTVGVVVVLMDVTAVLKTLLTHRTPPVKTLMAVREVPLIWNMDTIKST